MLIAPYISLTEGSRGEKVDGFQVWTMFGSDMEV